MIHILVAIRKVWVPSRISKQSQTSQKPARMLSPYGSMTRGTKCLKTFAHYRHDNPRCKLLGACAELNLVDKQRGVFLLVVDPWSKIISDKASKGRVRAKRKVTLERWSFFSTPLVVMPIWGISGKQTNSSLMIFTYIQGSKIAYMLCE